MVPTKDRLAFAGMAAVLVTVPGPSVVFTISRALTYGRRTALLNMASNTLGLVVQVAFGLGAVIERPAEVFTGLKLAGAAYAICGAGGLLMIGLGVSLAATGLKA